MPDGKDMSTPGPVGAMFSTAAKDYAEVVHPDAPPGPDHLWSTESNAEPIEGSEGVVDGELLDENDPDTDARSRDDDGRRHADAGPWSEEPRGTAHGADAGRWGGVFSAEPVARPSDVIDQDDADLDGGPGSSSIGVTLPRSTVTGEPLFASAPSSTDVGRSDDEPAGSPGNGSDEGSPGSLENGSEPAATAATSGSPFATPDDDVGSPPRWPTQASPATPPPYRGHAGLEGDFNVHQGADPNGLRAAISRLDPRDVEQASVPIAVCGALLHDGESVLGAVTGQMLGRPAVVVVTGHRVLVVNDRRWQPIVDEFRIDSSLIVRGRHDRNVAALSFADATRLAMVDNITEVALAIDLAERIRSAGIH